MAKTTQVQKYSTCQSCLSYVQDAVDLVQDPDQEDLFLGVLESPGAYVVQMHMIVSSEHCDQVGEHA
jgi:hypothetical protein